LKKWWQSISYSVQTIMIVGGMLLLYALPKMGVNKWPIIHQPHEKSAQELNVSLEKILRQIDANVKNGSYERQTFLDSQLNQSPYINYLHKNTRVYSLIYQNEKVIFWNTEKILPNLKAVINSSDSLFSSFTASRYFISYRKFLSADHQKVLWVNIPIKEKLGFANADIQNKMFFDGMLECGVDTFKKAHASPLTLKGKVMFYITHSNNYPAYQYYLFGIINIFCLWAWVIAAILLFIHLSKQHKILPVYLLLILIFIIHRFIFYQFNYPNVMPTKMIGEFMFNQNLYFNDLFGGIIYNYILIFIAIIIFRWKFLPIQLNIKNDWLQFLIVVLNGCLFAFFGFKAFHVIINIIKYSAIDFEVSVLQNLNSKTLIGYLFMFFGITLILFLIIIFSEIAKSIFGNNKKYFYSALFIIWICIFSGYTFLYQSVDKLDLYMACWIVVTTILLQFPNVQFYKNPFSFGTFILLFFLSFSITFFIQINNNDKIKNSLSEIAKQYLPDRDLVLEDKLDEVVNQIIADKVIEKNSLLNKQQLTDYLIRTYFINIQSSLSFPQSDTSDANLYQIGEKSLLAEHVSYLSNDVSNIQYIIRIPNQAMNIFIPCTKISPASINKIPDFLSFNNINTYSTSALKSEYKVSLFKKDTLVYRNHLDDFAIQKTFQNMFFYENKDGTLLQLKVGTNKCIVFKKSQNIKGFIVLFSFAFTWLILFLFLILFIYHIIKANGRYALFIKNINWNFRVRFFVILVCLEVFVFIVFILFVNNYSDKTIKLSDNKKMKYYGQILHLQLDQILSNQINYQFSDSTNSALFSVFQKYDFPFVLYDSNGNLLHTSLPILQDMHLEGYRLNPDIYYQTQAQSLANNDIITDHIHKFSYQIWNKKYTSPQLLSFYTNIPFYQQNASIQQSKLLFFAPLVDLLIILLLITSVIAYLLARYLSKRIKLLSDKMQQFDLQKSEQYSFINWQYDDELKPLIENYNVMVAKVEQSAKELADNQRDSAWREMAKQVAHEIKNPITPIRLTLQQLQRSIENNNPNLTMLTQRAITTIIDQIDSLNQIASNFSKFGQMPPSIPSTFILNELLQNAVYIYLQSNENIKIIYKPCDENITVHLDRNQIKRILNNLISNAIQAIPAEQIGVIEVNHLLKEKSTLITVTDNGKGISESESKNIFHPYFTTKTSGTGLGLAMSKDIVEKNGGKIWFTSQVGKGTTFYLEFDL
jgi:two-component system, NtrC family, nitrogen regulation sensor histidine kinase NtrY